jgi:hypothetical protein
VQKGDWVLLHAAAGGAGFLMTQILKSIGVKPLRNDAMISSSLIPSGIFAVWAIGTAVYSAYHCPDSEDSRRDQ